MQDIKLLSYIQAKNVGLIFTISLKDCKILWKMLINIHWLCPGDPVETLSCFFFFVILEGKLFEGSVITQILEGLNCV